MYKSLYIILFLFTASGAQAQQLPERSLVRKGNRQYNKGNYEQSAGRYEQALQAAPGQFEAIYNLGNALYKAERFDRCRADHAASRGGLAARGHGARRSVLQPRQRAVQATEVSGGARKLQAVAAPEPLGHGGKYNYAYTKRLLDENKDGGGGGGDQNKDQNQDQNKDQNQNDQSQQNPDQKGDQKDQKGDPKDQQGDQKQNPQEGKGDKEDQGDQQGQPTPSGISPQEQQQMLDAIQAQEDKTQEKLKEKQGVVVRGKKNW